MDALQLNLEFQFSHPIDSRNKAQLIETLHALIDEAIGEGYMVVDDSEIIDYDLKFIA
jgi:hypothetical protein